MKNIVDLMMKRVTEQLKAKDIEIELTDAARGRAGSAGVRSGARRAATAPHDPAARRGPTRREALYKEFRAGETVIVDSRDGEIVFEHTAGMLPPDVPPVELAGSPE